MSLSAQTQAAYPDWRKKSTIRQDWLILAGCLLAGSLHGLVWVWLVPPWQHYDEPSHFEYVWLVAHGSGWPQPGDSDPDLSRAVVTSMKANGFYKGMDYRPDLSLGAQVKIGGYSQLDERPLYYWFASFPLRFLPAPDVERQLIAARLVSLLFYGVTILAGWGLARELAPPGSPLRWMLPASLVLLPGLADILTAVNNDVAAIASMSLLTWFTARLIQRGWSLGAILLVLAAGAACYFSKSTSLAGAALVPFALGLGLVRNRWPALVWGVLMVGMAAGLVASLAWDEAAGYYRSTAQDEAAREPHSSAPVGDWVLRINSDASVSPTWMPPLFLTLPLETSRPLQNQEVTLGVWMWASQSMKAVLPVLFAGGERFTEEVELTTEPAFYAYTVTLPLQGQRVIVHLDPSAPGQTNTARIFYDGLVLAQGRWPVDQPPTWSDANAVTGVWDGFEFANLVRNGSAEKTGPRLRSWIDDPGIRFMPESSRPSLLLTTLLDVEAAGWFYQLTSAHLLRTFWARFGWGHIPLLVGRHPYRVVLAATLFGLSGALAAAVAWRRKLPWNTLLFLSLVLLGVWGITLLRSATYLGFYNLYLPVARYAYPAILATMAVLNLGWLAWGHALQTGWNRFIRKPAVGSSSSGISAGTALFFLFFITLDAVSIYSVIQYSLGVYR